MLLVLAWKPIGMQPQSMTIKAQQAIGFMVPPSGVPWSPLECTPRRERKGYFFPLRGAYGLAW